MNVFAKLRAARRSHCHDFKPEVIGSLPLTREQLDVIRVGLHGVVADRNGTARRSFLGLPIPVNGKTGTTEDPAGGEPHVWFVGYTKAERQDRPDIAVAVVLQNRGEGSEWAAWGRYTSVSTALFW